MISGCHEHLVLRHRLGNDPPLTTVQHMALIEFMPQLFLEYSGTVWLGTQVQHRIYADIGLGPGHGSTVLTARHGALRSGLARLRAPHAQIYLAAAATQHTIRASSEAHFSP